ncbi:MAG: HAMP domain-containing histidine kinase [Anaerolineae bacterium]|jgi:signal transduction histidine kinase|nr:HAMP domain-containing histidine kinase [Anaerolineae bacterium]
MMSWFDRNASVDGPGLLRDVLRLIARHPALDQAAPPLLQAACALTGATAAFYLLFDAPRVLLTEAIDPAHLPEDAALQAIAEALAGEFHLGTALPAPLAAQYRGWLIAPVRGKKQVVSLLALLFAGEMNVSDDKVALLLALLDALRVATTAARTDDRHQRLVHNQNEFVRITTHDLRQPLTVMKSIVGMIEAGMMSSDKLPGFMEKMSAGVNQMEFLVDNIQDAGRYDPETGFYEIQRAPVDLTELVRKIAGNYLRPAEKQELTVTVETGDDVPIIHADAVMLERAVTNLVDNAIKYTPNGGKIRVGVHRQAGDVVISVRDNGYGISPENARQLFTRHYRIRRREHNRVKGSGLGLFIVRSVAQQHDGTARVESVEGEGSTFFISIPLAGANLLHADADG